MYGVNRGIDAELPGLYLMEALFDVGPSDHATGGPILWQEIAAYAKVTGQISEPWELKAVMRMSRAYVTELQNGKDPLRIPPVDRAAMDG